MSVKRYRSQIGDVYLDEHSEGEYVRQGDWQTEHDLRVKAESENTRLQAELRLAKETLANIMSGTLSVRGSALKTGG